jgi:hypothetical protein
MGFFFSSDIRTPFLVASMTLHVNVTSYLCKALDTTSFDMYSYLYIS